MKNSLKVLKLTALLFVSGMAFADSNLQVSFVSDLKLDNTCNAIGSPASLAAANPPFRVVITNIGSVPITIKTVSFNGNDSMQGVTGSDYIKPNSDNALEQQYLLRSCDGKQIAPGKTCEIPMIVLVPGLDTYEATSAKDTFSVTATTDVSSADTATHSYTFSLAKAGDSPAPVLSLMPGSSDSNGLAPYSINNSGTEDKQVSIGCFFGNAPQVGIANLMSPQAATVPQAGAISQRVCMRDPNEFPKSFSKGLATDYRGYIPMLYLFDVSSEIPMPVYVTLITLQSVNNNYSC